MNGRDFDDPINNKGVLAYLQEFVGKHQEKEEAVRLYIYGEPGSRKSSLCRTFQAENPGIVKRIHSIDMVFPYTGRPWRDADNTAKLCIGQEQIEDAQQVLILEDIHLLASICDDFSLHQLNEMINHNRNMIITSEIAMQSLPPELRSILITAGFAEHTMKNLIIVAQRHILDLFALQNDLVLYREVREALIEIFDEDLEKIKDFLQAAMPIIERKRYRLKMQTLGAVMEQIYGRYSEYAIKTRRIVRERYRVYNDKGSL